MGVTDNRRNSYICQTSHNQNGETSSEEEGWQIINVEDADESPSPPPPVPVVQVRPRAQPKPLTARKKLPTSGHKLAQKKGRRSMHRYKEERNLFSSFLGEDANLEEAPDGWDIGYQDSKSHFTSLLDNEELLNDFIDDCEKFEYLMITIGQTRLNKGRLYTEESHEDSCESSEEDLDDPEQAFMAISQHSRQAIKKHLPLGMLEALENEITDFFIANPSSKYIASNLTSYERLLAHATSSYNQLYSRSFDKNGRRMLMVQNCNKYKTFKPVSPSLSKYLRIRSSSNMRN